MAVLRFSESVRNLCFPKLWSIPGLLTSYVTMAETNRIEFKRKLTPDLEKEVIAFLNYNEGGIIHIGIDNNSTVVGVSNIDSNMLQIKDRLKNNIRPSCLGLFDIGTEKKSGLDILTVRVASGPEKPYYLKKYGLSERGCFIRIGSSAESLPQRMIENLFARRTRNSIGKIKSPKQSLSFEQLKIYYDTAGIRLNNNFAENLELVSDSSEYNYVGYLLSDQNNLSIKVAKYRGSDRSDLIENNEYGFESLVKATKQVFDKVELENVTATKITPKLRQNKRLWNPIALREAIINAFVHNDYSKEVPPKFEIFNDRIEITSAGSLPEGLSQQEFFQGYSVPRNKEIMRIFRDLGLVEQLGSGVPRILESYSRECFTFSENFLRMSFPVAEGLTPQVPPQVTPQVTPQVLSLVEAIDGEMSREELQMKLGLSDRKHFQEKYIRPALEQGIIEYTIPEKPKSSAQKYRLGRVGYSIRSKP